MNQNLDKARDKFIEGVSRMSDTFGLNRFAVQMYIFLYLTGKPLSLDEIGHALGASKGNVSINIRELEKWGAVRQVWVKSSRKDYYEAEPDIKKVFANKLKTAMQKRLLEVSSIMDEFYEAIKSKGTSSDGEDDGESKIYQERLKRIKDLMNLASNALSIADKFL